MILADSLDKFILNAELESNQLKILIKDQNNYFSRGPRPLCTCDCYGLKLGHGFRFRVQTNT